MTTKAHSVKARVSEVFSFTLAFMLLVLMTPSAYADEPSESASPSSSASSSANPSASSSASSASGSGVSASGDTITSDGSAESITALAIAMASNLSKDNSPGLDLSSLKQEEARFVGVFLSNYYTPFVTEFGDSEEGSDTTQQAKDGMKKVLVDTMGMSDANASTLTEFTWAKVKETASSESGALHWEVSKEPVYSGSGIKLDTKAFPATMYNLQMFSAGGFGSDIDPLNNDNSTKVFDAVKSKWESAKGQPSYDNTFKSGFKDGMNAVFGEGNHYAHLVTSDGFPMYSVDLSGTEVTPSAHAYYKAVAQSGTEGAKNGFGTSFFDFTKKEWDDGALDKATLKNTVWGQELRASAFGDIISAGGAHQYAVIPASSNPYAFEGVGDFKDNVPGSTYYMQNSLGINSSASSSLFTSSSNNQCEIGDYASLNGVYGAIKLSDRDPNPSYRFIRGDSGTDFDTSDTFFSGINAEGTTVLDLAREYASQFMEGEAETLVNYDQGIVETQSQYAFDMYADGKDSYGIPAPYRTRSGNGARGFTLGEIVFTERSMPCNGKVVLADLMNLWEGKKVKYETFNVADANDNGNLKTLTGEGEEPTALNVKAVEADLFKNSLNSSEGYAGLASEALSSSNAYVLYLTYVMASVQDGEGTDIQKELGFRLNNDMPKIPDTPFELSEEAQESLAQAQSDEIDRQIKEWLYYFMHPSEGIRYFQTWFKNKTTGVIVQTHNDMVGANNAPVIAGSTRYIGFSGYVTVPNLTDLQWTDTLYNGYKDNFMYFFFAIFFIILIYTVVGVLKFKEFVASVLLFTALAWATPNLLVGGIDTTNNTIEKIYSKKFTYWAVVQNQTFAKEIDEAATAPTYEQYLKSQYQALSNADITGTGGNNKGTDSVVVKWQAPKKMKSLIIGDSEIDKEVLENPSGNQFIDLVGQGMNESVSGQSYTGRSTDTFLYRSYIDLHNFSKYIYKGIVDGTVVSNPVPNTANWSDDLYTAFGEAPSAMRTYNLSGYGVDSLSNAMSSEIPSRVTVPMSSGIVNDALAQVGSMESMTSATQFGVDTRAFSFGLPMFTGGTGSNSDASSGSDSEPSESPSADASAEPSDSSDSESSDSESSESSAPASNLDFMETLKTNANRSNPSGAVEFDPSANGYTEEDYVSLAMFGLMSESPYYYYAWTLYDQGIGFDGADESFKDLVLSADGRGYFYNTVGNGEMRDFLDNRSLFTYVIPYLHEVNGVVEEYDRVYGLKYTPGIPTVEGFESELGEDPELQAKYAQNLATARILTLYTPWVDLMYDTSYAKSQEINVLGEDVVIRDPINPASYPENRPMVFSESEMVDMGLQPDDLTEVEKRIIDVSKSSVESMFGLLNSYNFNNSVLVTASAMQTTFSFNSTFSDTNFLGIGDTVTLYPQSFELKSFSYDPYLRMVLSQSTGEDITSSSGSQYYTDIINNSSMLTGIVMWLLDIVSVYVIPWGTLLAVLGIALLSMAKVYTGVLRVEEGKQFWKTVRRGLLFPLGILLAVSFIRAWITSLFLSNGNTAVTGYSGFSISLGDPVLAMVAMLSISIIYMAFMFYTIATIYKGLFETSQVIGASLKGVGSQVVSGFKSLTSGGGVSGALSAMRTSSPSSSSSSSPSSASAPKDSVASSASDRASSGAKSSMVSARLSRVSDAESKTPTAKRRRKTVDVRSRLSRSRTERKNAERRVQAEDKARERLSAQKAKAESRASSGGFVGRLRPGSAPASSKKKPSAKDRLNGK